MKKKGVVVEIAPRNKVIIMTAEGEFVKVPFKKHVHVGQEIRFSPKKEGLTGWQLGVAAVLFLITMGSWPFLSDKLVSLQIEPEYFVTVDLNFSIELKLSDQHRVLAAEGLNREGQALVPHLDIVGTDLRFALAEIVGEARQAGYLERTQNQVTVTIASPKDGDDVTLAELKNRRSGEYSELEREIEDVFETTLLADVRIWQVPLKLQKDAKAAGITPNRYVAINMPIQRVVPQRLEARLTMHEDPPELPKLSSLGSGVQPPRPALTPAQRTQQNQTVSGTSSAYRLSFPLVAQAKGDYRFYE